MALPHIQNSEAGRNYYEPYFSSLFEAYFTVPAALQAKYGKDVELLSEQVTKVSGLDGLDRTPETVQQNFHGSTRTYLQPHLSDTSFEITVTLNLNLRNEIDNYVYNLFKAWNKLNYNMDTGETTFKSEYLAEFFSVAIANRKGDIIRDIIFKDVMLAKITPPSDLDYTANDAQTIDITFKSDWAQDKSSVE